MLSPHEIATLILVKDAPDPFDLDPSDLDTLVTLEGACRGNLEMTQVLKVIKNWAFM